jgi:serine/threonine protein kinase
MPLMEILNIVRGIGSALDYAHSRGVVHRDVKPANIIVSVDGVPILTDFGLALSASEGTLGDTFGSAHYIAPEQAISSARAVPQSDQYSLGVCLYEMLAGRVPFDDPSAMSVALKHLNDPPPPLRDRVPDLPVALEAVVLRTLAKDPAERYASAADMAHALAAAIFDSSSDIQPGKREFSARDPASIYEDEAWPDESATPASAPTPGKRPHSSALSDTSTASSVRRSSGPRRLIVAGALIALFAVAAATLLILRDQSAVVIGQDQTPTAAAIAASQTVNGIHPTPATALPPSQTLAPTDAATTPTSPPTNTARAVSPPTNTAVRISRATTAPTRIVERETALPTVTVSLVGELFLRYDGNQINMINLGERDLDLTVLDFAQRLPEAVYTFSNSRWAGVQGAARQPDRLPPGWCLQVSRLDVGLPEQFDECNFRAAYMLVADSSWFWLPGPGRRTGSFEVLIDGRVVATCDIGHGTCRFNLPPRS